MKGSTLSTLLVAKSIFDNSKNLIKSDNKYACTGGLILLQDFVELVVLAALDELDTEEQRNLESKSFDELLAQLKKQGAPVLRSLTVKALNKQRVISKHYGQLCEPSAVKNYLESATVFVDALLSHCIGKKLNEVIFTDLINESPAKSFVNESMDYHRGGHILEALISLRKAFFLEYEIAYSIYEFSANNLTSILGYGILAGQKAPEYTRNRSWIDANVKVPTDYVQMDQNQLKTDCLEINASTVEIENFRRLTPSVVRTHGEQWHIFYSHMFASNEVNDPNYIYCLEILISFLFKKQEFEAGKKTIKMDKSVPPPPVYIGKPIFEKPSQNSPILAYVEKDHFCAVHNILSGFLAHEKYLHVYLWPQIPEITTAKSHWGYLLQDIH